MQLSNTFTIDQPVDQVFAAFLDVEGIATCLPGSTLLGQPEPGTYEGEVKVKVGPLGVSYAGRLVVLDSDEEAYRLRMRGKGREKRGAGNAEAYIVATLDESAPGGTRVRIDTDLEIRGKVAQFGRGVIGEVTDGIMQQFARNVEARLSDVGHQAPRATGSTATSARPEPETPVTGTATPAGTDELDAWRLIVQPMLRRHGTGIATVVMAGVAAWLGARLGSRRRYLHH